MLHSQIFLICRHIGRQENLPELIRRIAKSLSTAKGFRWEVVIFDDNSRDGTAELCQRLAEDYPARLLIRESERGLSSAVVHGMRHARGDVLWLWMQTCRIRQKRYLKWLRHLKDRSNEFVIGSRYVAGGRTDESWGFFRWLNSKVATLMARPFTRARDPMAGFFAIRRKTLMRANALNPIGYKIALELIVKCHCDNVKEIPIEFQDRQRGQSKLNLREQINYLVHIVRLLDYKFEHLTCPVKFCLVGATGIAVDLTALAVFLKLQSMPLFTSRSLAIWLAMTWNLILNRQLTFRKDRGHTWMKLYPLFCASCLGVAFASWSVSVGLSHGTAFFGMHPLLAAGCGVIAGTALNYLCNRHFTFRRDAAEPSGNVTKNLDC